MRGYSIATDPSPPIMSALGAVNLLDLMANMIRDQTGLIGSLEVKEARLYYVRQTVGELNGRKIVLYFDPEFVYALNIGAPRLALIAVPYQVPTVPEGNSYRTIGRGDGEFPQLKEARAFSAASFENKDILYPVAPGFLTIGAAEGVSEAELRNALKNHVLELIPETSTYRARIVPFDEINIAKRIMSEVAAVRYAEPIPLVRSFAGPWWVDRVM